MVVAVSPWRGRRSMTLSTRLEMVLDSLGKTRELAVITGWIFFIAFWADLMLSLKITNIKLGMKSS